MCVEEKATYVGLGAELTMRMEPPEARQAPEEVQRAEVRQVPEVRPLRIRVAIG